MAKVRQQRRRNFDVILQEVSLRDSECWPEHLSQIAKMDFLAVQRKPERILKFRYLEVPRVFFGSGVRGAKLPWT